MNGHFDLLLSLLLLFVVAAAHSGWLARMSLAPHGQDTAGTMWPWPIAMAHEIVRGRQRGVCAAVTAAIGVTILYSRMGV